MEKTLTVRRLGRQPRFSWFDTSAKSAVGVDAVGPVYVPPSAAELLASMVALVADAGGYVVTPNDPQARWIGRAGTGALATDSDVFGSGAVGGRPGDLIVARTDDTRPTLKVSGELAFWQFDGEWDQLDFARPAGHDWSNMDLLIVADIFDNRGILVRDSEFLNNYVTFYDQASGSADTRYSGTPNHPREQWCSSHKPLHLV